MRIRTKTAILLFVTSLLPVGLLGFVFLPAFQKALTRSATQHLKSTAAVQAARVDLILKNQTDFVGWIGRWTPLQEGLAAYHASRHAEALVPVQGFLHDLLQAATAQGLRSATLLDTEGAVVATTDPDQTGTSYGGERFFQPALTHPVFISLSTAPDRDSWLSIRLAGPILWQGKVVGVILIRTESDDLAAMARDYSGLGETGETFLATQDTARGAIAYLTPLRFDPGATLARRPPSPDVSNDLTAAIVAGRSGFFPNCIDYRGESVLAVVRQIKSTPWFVVVKIDREEVFVQVIYLREVLGVSLLFVLLLVGALSLWASRTLTAPILHLEQIVHRVGEGNLSARASVDSEDELGRLATAFNNLAQRLQASNRQVQVGISELARSNADLAQFAYAASHDLQEPLRVIVSYLALLQRRYQGHLDQNADEFIAFVVDAAKRMQRLIHDLLTYSRVGREKTMAPTDLNAVFQEALDNLQAARRDVAMEITADPLPTVVARPLEMVQLFQNLLGNAIKFRGERPLEIHVGAARTADGLEWRFSVRDNGIGIDPKYVDRVFVIFERLHGVGGKYAGSGIGLALCRKIVEQHGGRIWVESALGQGSTFWFALPVADAASEKNVLVEKKNEGATGVEDAAIVQDGSHVEAVGK